jgi:chorismate mutase
MKKWLSKEGKFVKLSNDEIDELSTEDAVKYADACIADSLEKDEDLAKQIVELMKKGKGYEEEIAELKSKLNGVTIEDIAHMMKQLRIQGEALTKMKKEGKITVDTMEGDLKRVFDSKETELKDFNDNGGKSIKFTIKATQTYGDIDAGLDYAQFKPGITDIPVRMPKIRQIFPVLPLSTEHLKYTEQNTVVRDAQNVAVCAAVTSTTKETLVVNDIATKMVKDQIDFCRKFVEDYPFMRSRIDRLINQSLSLRIDSQLLLGDGTGENISGIDSYASEFNAANAVCDISASIQAATYVDLLLGMETQVDELGEQNAYNANVGLVNKCDWFIFVQSRKDLNNNYLDGRVTMVNGVPQVGNLSIIWTPIVPQNENYVFDSTKGEIVDRQQLEIEVAFENKDNWEKEIASIKGTERLNLLVENNNANAFMKCTDVAAALLAITI